MSLRDVWMEQALALRASRMLPRICRRTVNHLCLRHGVAECVVDVALNEPPEGGAGDGAKEGDEQPALHLYMWRVEPGCVGWDSKP